MAEQKWASAEVARLWDMFGQGQSDREIADALGRTVRSVANKRHTLGIKRYSRRTRPRDGEAARWARRSRALLELVELALAGADAKVPHREIAEDIRRGLRLLPEA